jgi:hypothetical protein
MQQKYKIEFVSFQRGYIEKPEHLMGGGLEIGNYWNVNKLNRDVI